MTWGVGTTYGRESVLEPFLQRGVACVGYGPGDSPAIHRLLSRIQIGDLVYLKIRRPDGVSMDLRAVGVVIGAQPTEVPDLGWGVQVQWFWRGDERVVRSGGSLPGEPYNVWWNTLYEELDQNVQEVVLSKLLLALEQSRGSAVS